MSAYHNSEHSRNGVLDKVSNFRDAPPNVRFYRNEIPACPNQESIDEILTYWYGNYVTLEENHNFIQWLFPNRQPGVNQFASVLTDEEAQIIRTTPKLKEKVMEAFKMMLDFYGMKLNEENQFELAKNSEERLKELNTWRNHNFRRITRILLALKELGHDKFTLSWMLFLADLIYKEKKLDQAEDSFEKFWIGSLDAEDQLKIRKYKNKLLPDRPPGLPNKNIPRNNNESFDDKHVHSRPKYAKKQMSSIPETDVPQTDKWGFSLHDTTSDTEEISPANTIPKIPASAPPISDSLKDNVFITTSSSTVAESSHDSLAGGTSTFDSLESYVIVKIPDMAPGNTSIPDRPKDNVTTTTSSSTVSETAHNLPASATSIPDRLKDNVTTTASSSTVFETAHNLPASATSTCDSLKNFVIVNSSDVVPENMSNTTTATFSSNSDTNTQEADNSGHIWYLFNQINPFS